MEIVGISSLALPSLQSRGKRATRLTEIMQNEPMSAENKAPSVYALEELLELISLTAKRAKKLLQQTWNAYLETPPSLQDYFSALDKKCIECVFGDYFYTGEKIIKLISKKPKLLVPAIVTRLNSYESIDLRNWHFKKHDSRYLSSRYLISEIKGWKEKQQNEDDFLVRSISKWYKQTMVPKLEWEYSDADIHQDLFQLIEFSCQKLKLSNEEFRKVIKLWKTILEPVLGLPVDANYSGEVSDLSLFSSKPLQELVCNTDRKNADVFYGNNDFYVLFRLHRILYGRFFSAKTKLNGSADSYARLMTAVNKFLNGSSDNTKFENECQALLGDRSYVLFTLQELLQLLVQQLQTVTTSELHNKLVELYEYEKSRGLGKFAEPVYYENARAILLGENMYRFSFSSAPSCLSIQLMDSVTESQAFILDDRYLSYMRNYILSESANEKGLRAIALKRNMRKYHKLDDVSAMSSTMEGVQLSNGLEIRIDCNTYKAFMLPLVNFGLSQNVGYVHDTEDFFFRPKKKRNTARNSQCSLKKEARVKLFNKFLEIKGPGTGRYLTRSAIKRRRANCNGIYLTTNFTLHRRSGVISELLFGASSSLSLSDYLSVLYVLHLLVAGEHFVNSNGKIHFRDSKTFPITMSECRINEANRLTESMQNEPMSGENKAPPIYALEELLELISLTAKRAEKLLQQTWNAELETPLSLLDYFSALDKKCIQCVFGNLFSTGEKVWKEKQQNEDDFLVRSISDGYKQTTLPKLEWEYSDADIHRDLFQLIEFSCQKLKLSNEEFGKVIKLWKTILEPMLGLPVDANYSGEVSDRSFFSSKPLQELLCNTDRKNADVFYGNNNFYVLFRLHRILYGRFFSAKTKFNGSADSYARLMTAVNKFLNGSSDNTKFENECQALLGDRSYVLFTLKELLQFLVQQLQTVTTSELHTNLVELYEYEKSRGPGKFAESVYYKNAGAILQGEDMYRFSFSSAPSCLSIQLMVCVTKSQAFILGYRYLSYIRNYILSESTSQKSILGIALKRNMRKYHKLDDVSAIMSSAMEGVQLSNGLEIRIDCNTYKVRYIYDTEDFFFRPKKKRKTAVTVNVLSRRRRE
ncbi:hypothetical protein ACFE04_009161 [Oxalis oulophora]